MPTHAVFYVPALFTTLFTIVIGGLFLVAAWAQVLIELPPEAPRNIHISLVVFTAAVLVDAVGVPIVWETSDSQNTGLWVLLLLASFACVIGSRWLVREDRGPSSRTVKIGSTVVIVGVFLGFLGILSGMPKIW